MAAELEDDSELEELNLDNAGLTGADIIALARAVGQHAGLRQLDLSRNAVSSAGVQAAIVNALAKNRSLTCLGLDACSITDEGIRCLAGALDRNATLQILTLSHNAIGFEGASALAEALRSSACRLRRLEVAHVGLRRELAAEFLSGVADNSSLEALVLRDNPLGDEGLEEVAIALQRNTTLRELDLSRCGFRLVGTQSLFAALRVRRSLPSLDLSGNDLGQHVGAIEVLASAVAQGSGLQVLDLSSNSLGDTEVELLSGALEAAGCSLRELRLERNAVGENGGERLAAAIGSNKTLQVLLLSENRMSDKGAMAFASALQVNKALRELEIARNDITCIGAKSFAMCLIVNVTLESLGFAGNRLEDWGASELALGVAQNRRLSKLDLQHNRIGNVGIGELAASLAKNTKLKELIVDGNPADREALVVLEELASER